MRAQVVVVAVVVNLISKLHVTYFVRQLKLILPMNERTIAATGEIWE